MIIEKQIVFVVMLSVIFCGYGESSQQVRKRFNEFVGSKIEVTPATELGASTLFMETWLTPDFPENDLTDMRIQFYKKFKYYPFDMRKSEMIKVVVGAVPDSLDAQKTLTEIPIIKKIISSACGQKTSGEDIVSASAKLRECQQQAEQDKKNLDSEQVKAQEVFLLKLQIVDLQKQLEQSSGLQKQAEQDRNKALAAQRKAELENEALLHRETDLRKELASRSGALANFERCQRDLEQEQAKAQAEALQKKSAELKSVPVEEIKKLQEELAKVDAEKETIKKNLEFENVNVKQQLTQRDAQITALNAARLDLNAMAKKIKEIEQVFEPKA